MGEIDEREKKVQTFSIKELGYGNEKYSTGNIVSNIITSNGDRWSVHLLWYFLMYINVKSYCLLETNIVCQLYFN